jgi:type VI secretion system secreted protein Hcp
MEDSSMRKIPLVLFLGCICFFSISNLAYSEVDVLLFLTGIPGESDIPGHQDKIDVLAWSWEVGNPNQSISSIGGRTAARAIVEPLVVRKLIDKASPVLILAALNGNTIPEAILYVRKAGEDAIDYIKITMSNVQISNVTNGGDSNMYLPTEDVKLVFSEVCYIYTPQKNDGSPDLEIETCWDVARNRPINP